MPDLLTDLARVRELMARAEAGERVAARAQADAYNFLRTHASGIEAMARDAVTVDDGMVDRFIARYEHGPICGTQRERVRVALLDAMKEAGRE